ncbi:HAD domain-containing protein [Ralstonia pseudosolanacearum]|uniref:HAD domain-containing protein n=2 Tax=Ralstonia pseudosolanacearum TaxID=1310165 RepID=UPI003CF90ACB
MSTPSSATASLPLAVNLQTLGLLVASRRAKLGLNLVEAAYGARVSPSVLVRLEAGKPVRTDSLFKVLTALGLPMLVMPKDNAIDALWALGHQVHWDSVMRALSPASERKTSPALVLDRTVPTILLDYDGTLHAGQALLDNDGRVTLDSGRQLLEFAPLLVEMLRPYPSVEIVLTTSWLQALPVDVVISYLPQELAQRVVDTTKNIKPRLSYEHSGAGRTDVIVSYTYGKRLKNWLALDDSAYGASKFGREPGELTDHFLLLDSALGISDDSAQRRIRQWLIEVHGVENM